MAALPHNTELTRHFLSEISVAGWFRQCGTLHSSDTAATRPVHGRVVAIWHMTETGRLACTWRIDPGRSPPTLG